MPVKYNIHYTYSNLLYSQVDFDFSRQFAEPPSIGQSIGELSEFLACGAAVTLKNKKKIAQAK